MRQIINMLFLLSMLFLVQTVHSQDTFEGSISKPATDANIYGHVVDKDGNHLPFVTVAIKGTTVGTTTDATGHYYLTNLKTETLVLVASSVGYRIQEKRIAIEGRKNIEVNFVLEKDVVTLDQIVITGNRVEVNRKESTNIVNVISPKMFQASQIQNLSDGLSFVPGVRVENNCQNCGFNQVRLNGMEGPYSQILMNGRPIFSGLASVYGLELIPTEMIERVEVLRGGGSALYGGNAIAGVINIITREPLQNSFQFSSTSNNIGVGNYSDISKGIDIGYNAAMRSSTGSIGAIIYGNTTRQAPWDANSDSFSELGIKKGRTHGISIFYKPDYLSKINANFYTLNEMRKGGDGFDRTYHDSQITESVDHDINGWNVDFFRYIDDRQSNISIYTAFQSVGRKSYYGANFDTTAYGNSQSKNLNTGFQVNWNRDRLLLAPAKIVSGIDYQFGNIFDERLASENDMSIPNTVVSDQQSHVLGLFLQNEWLFSRSRFLIGARVDGLRIDDLKKETAKFQSFIVVPRANWLVDLNEQMQGRISFSTGYRAPQIFDEDLHILSSGARRIMHVNDPGLSLERSLSFSGSVDYSKSMGETPVYFLSEFFFTRLSNPFAINYEQSDTASILYAIRVNETSGANVYGLNLEGKLALGRNIELQSGYTIQKSYYDQDRQWGEDSLNVSNRILRTPEQYGFLTITYDRNQHFTVSATGIFTGPMYVPHLPGGVAPNGEIIDREELVKTKSFFDLGLKVAKKFDIGSDLHLEVYAGVKNILNSFQDDFDRGINRDAGYIYGPKYPRTIYFGMRFGLF